MKRVSFTLALILWALPTSAEEVARESFAGHTKQISYDRMIAPHGLEVTYDKTVHIIFPSAVTYVDLGSEQLVAGKAEGAENVIRVKSTIRGFEGETNMSVITDNGNFYTFNVRYSEEPEMLNVEMVDFIHDGESVNRPNNALSLYLKELGSDSPKIIQLIMKSIYDNNRVRLRGVGSAYFGVEYLLKSIYTNEGVLYLHTQINNRSNIRYDIDYITMKIVDRKVLKRTAMQERVIEPLRAYNYVTQVAGQSSERSVFALEKFTIPDNKHLLIELHERNGGRHQTIKIRNREVINAATINTTKK